MFSDPDGVGSCSTGERMLVYEVVSPRKVALSPSTWRGRLGRSTDWASLPSRRGFCGYAAADGSVSSGERRSTKRIPKAVEIFSRSESFGEVLPIS